MNAPHPIVWDEAAERAVRFPNVSCSQCTKDFGPGDSGFSSCREHRARSANMQLAIDEAFERDEAMRLYLRLLSEADWSYAMAQDHHAWQDGVKQFDRLYMLQALVDADGTLWRAAAEASKAWAAPQPRVVSEPIDLGYLSGSTL